MTNDNDTPEPRIRTQGLDTKRRIPLGAVGLVLVVFGTLAVFKTDNEAGTLALLLTGAGFLVLAVTGILPRRLTVGGNSVEYGELAGVVVSAALKSDEPGVREEVARIIIDAAEGNVKDAVAGSAAAIDLTRRARAALLEDETLEAVRAHLPEGCIEHKLPGRIPAYGVYFGPPGAPPSRWVCVTVLWASLRRSWLGNYKQSARRDPAGAFVYIGPGNDLPVIASHLPPIYTIGWAGPDDDYKLEPVLSAALRTATTGDVASPKLN